MARSPSKRASRPRTSTASDSPRSSARWRVWETSSRSTTSAATRAERNASERLVSTDSRGVSLGELTSDLERALLRALANEWKHLNWSHFREKLAEPQLTLVDSTAHLGLWVPHVRTIEIARRLVLGHSWGVVVEVLKHEMAHQYVHEQLGVVDESAHGPAFRAVCEKLGIDGRA